MKPTRIVCSYLRPLPYRQRAYCLHDAPWLVTYTQPVPRDADRDATGETTTHRCWQHSGSRFLPRNATNIRVERVK